MLRIREFHFFRLPFYTMLEVVTLSFRIASLFVLGAKIDLPSCVRAISTAYVYGRAHIGGSFQIVLWNLVR